MSYPSGVNFDKTITLYPEVEELDDANTPSSAGSAVGEEISGVCVQQRSESDSRERQQPGGRSNYSVWFIEKPTNLTVGSRILWEDSSGEAWTIVVGSVVELGSRGIWKADGTARRP